MHKSLDGIEIGLAAVSGEIVLARFGKRRDLLEKRYITPEFMRTLVSYLWHGEESDTEAVELAFHLGEQEYKLTLEKAVAPSQEEHHAE